MRSASAAVILTVEPAVNPVSPVGNAVSAMAVTPPAPVGRSEMMGSRFERFQRTPRQRPTSAFMSAVVSAYWCEETKVESLARSCSWYGSITPAYIAPGKLGAPSWRSVATMPETKSVVGTSVVASVVRDVLPPGKTTTPPPISTFWISRSWSSAEALPSRSVAAVSAVLRCHQPDVGQGHDHAPLLEDRRHLVDHQRGAIRRDPLSERRTWQREPLIALRRIRLALAIRHIRRVANVLKHREFLRDGQELILEPERRQVVDEGGWGTEPRVAVVIGTAGHGGGLLLDRGALERLAFLLERHRPELLGRWRRAGLLGRLGAGFLRRRAALSHRPGGSTGPLRLLGGALLGPLLDQGIDVFRVVHSSRLHKRDRLFAGNHLAALAVVHAHAVGFLGLRFVLRHVLADLDQVDRIGHALEACQERCREGFHERREDRRVGLHRLLGPLAAKGRRDTERILPRETDQRHGALLPRLLGGEEA